MSFQGTIAEYRRRVAISVGGGDQALAPPCNAVFFTTAGNMACRFAGDTADSTVAVTTDKVYPYSIAVIRQTGTTAAGYVLYR